MLSRCSPFDGLTLALPAARLEGTDPTNATVSNPAWAASTGGSSVLQPGTANGTAPAAARAVAGGSVPAQTLAVGSDGGPSYNVTTEPGGSLIQV
jgi:hypothetical protein